MSILTRFLLFESLIIFTFAAPSCKEKENFCSKCNPLTNLCLTCQNSVLKPDENGGCEPTHKCELGHNYCIECNKEENLCSKCDEGHYPDENGGCSYALNCEISYKGDCLKCKEDYLLIGKKGGLFFCKSPYSDDLKNCKEINTITGKCNNCSEGFYLNEGDKKCTKTENCFESTFGVCSSCIANFYYNKKEDKCIQKKEEKFLYCKVTIDGETCDQCDNNYYFAEDGNCVHTNFCSKGESGNCNECISNYFLTHNKTCSDQKNCFSSDRYNGFCSECNINFCLDYKTRQCIPSHENNEFQYCKLFKEGKCLECDYSLILGEDHRCTNTKNCKESEDGICKSCSENYYLGLDNRCTNVEHCIYSTEEYGCYLCEDNYYYDINTTSCIYRIAIEGCQHLLLEGEVCQNCISNYYLNRTDHRCYSNEEEGEFYKCAYTDSTGTVCESCLFSYVFNKDENQKSHCTPIDYSDCKKYDSNYTCLECNEGFCLDVKYNLCIDNRNFLDTNGTMFFKYYRCNRTNEEGEACEECADDSLNVNENGWCVDSSGCEKEEDGVCIKCKDEGIKCLNQDFGCVESLFSNDCLRCDDYFMDFDFQCTECIEGYYLPDEFGSCFEIESE